MRTRGWKQLRGEKEKRKEKKWSGERIRDVNDRVNPRVNPTLVTELTLSSRSAGRN